MKTKTNGALNTDVEPALAHRGSAIELWPSSADGFWLTSGPSTYGRPDCIGGAKRGLKSQERQSQFPVRHPRDDHYTKACSEYAAGCGERSPQQSHFELPVDPANPTTDRRAPINYQKAHGVRGDIFY